MQWYHELQSKNRWLQDCCWWCCCFSPMKALGQHQPRGELQITVRLLLKNRFSSYWCAAAFTISNRYVELGDLRSFVGVVIIVEEGHIVFLYSKRAQPGGSARKWMDWTATEQWLDSVSMQLADRWGIIHVRVYVRLVRDVIQQKSTSPE